MKALLITLTIVTATHRALAQAPLAPATPLSSPEAATTQAAPGQKETGGYQNAALTYLIIDAPSGTFGYDVMVDGKLVIHQTSIPALPGNNGFKSRDDAAKVAEMVMYKIRKGIMPPTVTPEEMKELGVIE